jgi:pyrroline-5-carboxylate reductase
VSTTASLQDISQTVVLVGAGKMGTAMLEGWLARGLDASRVTVIEPQPSPAVTALGTRGLKLNPQGTVGQAGVVIVAVKPQVAGDVMPALAPLVDAGTVVVSIMAGKPLKFLQSMLPAGAAVVRTMPNTPAAIGRGITVAVPNDKVSAAQRTLASRLLEAAGDVEWIADEALMDAVTAVSGSGPAYVFLLAESLAKAGAAAGLPAALAEKLARVTVAGSGELLHRAPDDAATLRKNVTSPGGTTAAALGVLMAPDGLDPLMEKAVDAATRRSRELGS